MPFYNTGTNFLDEYGVKPPKSSPAPYVPSQPAAPTVPQGWIGGPGVVAPPVFNPGPSLNNYNVNDAFKNAFGNVSGAVTDTHNQDQNVYRGTPLNAPSANDFSSSLPDFTGGDGGPSGPPSFNFNANTDPGVLAALGLENQGLGQLDANLKAARERAIIAFGDPSLAAEAGFGLDPQAGAFAKQNYLSGNATLARIDKQDKLARQAIINKLVSHGLLRSGDLGYQQGEENSAYGNQVYDAKQQLLDYLSGLFQTYQDKRNQLSQNVVGARLSALQNFLANPDAYAGVYG